MRRRKTRRGAGLVQAAIALLPIGLAARGIFGDVLLWTGLSALAVFLLCAFLPMCRGRESLWAFVLGVPCGIPAALRCVVWFLDRLLLSDSLPLQAVRGAFLFLLLLAFWGIALAFLSRLLWRRQREGYPAPPRPRRRR